MLRTCTRQLTRLRPRLSHCSSLPRCGAPSVTTLLQQQRNYCPRMTREEYRQLTKDAIKRLQQQEEGTVSNTNEAQDAEELPNYVTPDEILDTLVAHVERHWPRNRTPPKGWSTDFVSWQLLATLFAPSPTPFMLPQLCLVLLRHGVKNWDGLTPDLGDVVPSNTGGEMFRDMELVLQLRGERYRIIFGDQVQILRLTSPDSLDGMVVPEDPAGVALFEKLMDREESAALALHDQGYVPLVLDVTTPEEEEATLVPGTQDAMPEGLSDPQQAMHLKMQIDTMMREMGVEPPQDPEEWEAAFETVTQKVKDTIGGPDGIEKVGKEIDSLMKLADTHEDLIHVFKRGATGSKSK